MVAASILINITLDLARAILDDSKDLFSRYGGAVGLLDNIYYQTCKGNGMEYVSKKTGELDGCVYYFANSAFHVVDLHLATLCELLKSWKMHRVQATADYKPFQD